MAVGQNLRYLFLVGFTTFLKGFLRVTGGGVLTHSLISKNNISVSQKEVENGLQGFQRSALGLKMGCVLLEKETSKKAQNP